MTVHYKIRGFVFKKEDRLETDRIFSVFTEEFGRLEIFAKAIRKIASKLRGGMEMFSIADIEFIQGKYRKTLTDAVCTQKFTDLAVSPEKIEIAQKISSLLDIFIKGEQTDQKVWMLVTDFFEKLHGVSLQSSHWQLAYDYFFWNLVSVLGYAPELSLCIVCRKTLNPSDLYFSSNEGGTMCGSCALSRNNANLSFGAIKVSGDAVKILRLFLCQDWQTVVKLKAGLESLKTLEALSEDYGIYLTGVMH
ncbi:MAG: DNA repair protein RecO [Candidatus Staskawiczbacteria bacterium RIFCSPHIGHO2_02_FULL_42_22]|uniref:DNA repair protein RecO n=1 Tax=Candidatus Staskawiczbacteria bacterium RIFCSPHIGHO2_02_FULL_42_22 TaxID=1802207 RepID=A0A1G2I422_9BACT|nr:MAG: DNA repair protein RecO [Candidatus Staskawiczbacteria bacterium RIFCSPHIGHO2_02_FULL_42_22]